MKPPRWRTSPAWTRPCNGSPWPRTAWRTGCAFFSGLARCLDRNIGLIKSLQLQANRVKTPKYRGIIAELAYDLSIGEKFSDAASKHPMVFPMEILSLLIAGEEAGQLPAVCKRIGGAQKKTARIIKKLKTGMIYPCIVLVMAVGVVIAHELHPGAGDEESL